MNPGCKAPALCVVSICFELDNEGKKCLSQCFSC